MVTITRSGGNVCSKFRHTWIAAAVVPRRWTHHDHQLQLLPRRRRRSTMNKELYVFISLMLGLAITGPQSCLAAAEEIPGKSLSSGGKNDGGRFIIQGSDYTINFLPFLILIKLAFILGECLLYQTFFSGIKCFMLMLFCWGHILIELKYRVALFE